MRNSSCGERNTRCVLGRTPSLLPSCWLAYPPVLLCCCLHMSVAVLTDLHLGCKPLQGDGEWYLGYVNREADEVSKRSAKYRVAKDGKPDTRVTAYFRALVRAAQPGMMPVPPEGGGHAGMCVALAPPVRGIDGYPSQFAQPRHAVCHLRRLQVDHLCAASLCPPQLDQVVAAATAEQGLGFLTSQQALYVRVGTGASTQAGEEAAAATQQQVSSSASCQPCCTQERACVSHHLMSKRFCGVARDCWCLISWLALPAIILLAGRRPQA